MLRDFLRILSSSGLMSLRDYTDIFTFTNTHNTSPSRFHVYMKGDIVYFSENAHNCPCQNISLSHIYVQRDPKV